MSFSYTDGRWVGVLSIAVASLGAILVSPGVFGALGLGLVLYGLIFADRVLLTAGVPVIIAGGIGYYFNTQIV